MVHPRAQAARAVWRSVEPVHAVTYFSPEPLAALGAAGYRGFWMGYFAGRAAPLGPVSAEVVHALFHNFAFDQVARAVPDAWTFAGPEAALAARLDGSVAALGRQLAAAAVEGAPVERAAGIAERAALAAPLEGRALFAANRALTPPEEPLARLWHATTLLREHRGDGHVAALTAAGIGGRESHVLHALATGTPSAVYRAARRFDDAEWDALVEGMRQRGLVDGEGGLTERGREVKEGIEQTTDELAASAYAVLTDAELDDLLAALAPVRAAVVAAGEIPGRSPVGLDLSES